MTGIKPIGFDHLPGWAKEDHKAAFAAFRHSAAYLIKNPPRLHGDEVDIDALLACAHKALELGEECDEETAKGFFEDNFTPHRIDEEGFVTGYFEPSFEGSREKSAQFPVPLHRRPADLVAVTEEDDVSHLSPETSFARKSEDGLSYHFSRADIMGGALDGENLELVWLKDDVDAFTIHVQGSARINLDKEDTMRVAFDGKSGHAYQSIGKILIGKGIFTKDTITMDKVIAYLRENEEEAQSLLRQNPSYIYFKEQASLERDQGPLAAAQIPLLPMRSMAVDRHCRTFGIPIWLETCLPISKHALAPCKKLFFAHDTGSAIKGEARGDLFVGTGREAGSLAGQIKQQARFTLLLPKGS
ncbi:MAG: MltA domain-containing protein [Cohaesibacter sp.]|jgi:membrane-bound lytic murein transglycosylase A|nr:MltA domain-containing protein [Cohaesibacter sp.]